MVEFIRPPGLRIETLRQAEGRLWGIRLKCHCRLFDFAALPSE
jgi:hypothetical protein